jgi:predicted small lipoprotein YifL
MKRWFMTFAVLSCLAASGCGGGDQGPADASDIPPVDEAAINKSIESGMPQEMKDKYGIGGGSSAPAGTAPAKE